MEEELNVQHSTLNVQRRIKEILNTEKEEMTNDRKSPSPDEYIRRCHPSPTIVNCIMVEGARLAEF